MLGKYTPLDEDDGDDYNQNDDGEDDDDDYNHNDDGEDDDDDEDKDASLRQHLVVGTAQALPLPHQLPN